MAPFLLGNGVTSLSGFLVPFIIGLGFGYVLEISGFGDSRKLSGQFYLREMTVLKVMFTAIIVAMTLLYLSSALGLLNFDKIFINPTYFASGIVGGLIMGVGFIVGGFCPGTSLVAAATFKLDGVFFVLGAFFGVFLFGESLPWFSSFFYAGQIQRFTLDQVFGIPVGWVVVGILLMAFFMFYLAEISEKVFGHPPKLAPEKQKKQNMYKLTAAGTLLFLGVVALIIAQPSAQRKWQQIAAQENPKIEAREIYVDAHEFHKAMNDPMLYNVILDTRNESDYNMFHLESALHVTPKDLLTPAFVKRLKNMPDNTVKMLVSNDEVTATQAYKLLRGQGVINLYVLDGGMNGWWQLFPVAVKNIFEVRQKPKQEQAHYIFNKAYGDTLPQANPPLAHEEHTEENDEPPYKKKIKIETKTVVVGACG